MMRSSYRRALHNLPAEEPRSAPPRSLGPRAKFVPEGSTSGGWQLPLLDQLSWVLLLRSEQKAWMIRFWSSEYPSWDDSDESYLSHTGDLHIVVTSAQAPPWIQKLTDARFRTLEEAERVARQAYARRDPAEDVPEIWQDEPPLTWNLIEAGG